jgi:hypothetical protein
MMKPLLVSFVNLSKLIALDNGCPKFVQHLGCVLNNRTRKSLNWLRPAQVLAGITLVALRIYIRRKISAIVLK